MANVNLRYTGKEDTRVRAFHGKDKIAVGVGEEFESDVVTAAKLVKDHGKLFVYADDFVEPEKAKKVEDPRTVTQLKAELKAKGFDEAVYSKFGKAALVELLLTTPPVPVEAAEAPAAITDEQSGEPEEVLEEEVDAMPEPKGGAVAGKQKTA